MQIFFVCFSLHDYLIPTGPAVGRVLPVAAHVSWRRHSVGDLQMLSERSPIEDSSFSRAKIPVPERLPSEEGFRDSLWFARGGVRSDKY